MSYLLFLFKLTGRQNEDLYERYQKAVKVVLHMKNSQKSPPSIPLSIWALGSVSFLMKISAIIVYIISPLFITQVLGANTFMVVLLESFVEGITLLSRFFAGVLSDLIHRRKGIIAIGYLLAF